MQKSSADRWGNGIKPYLNKHFFSMHLQGSYEDSMKTSWKCKCIKIKMHIQKIIWTHCEQLRYHHLLKSFVKTKADETFFTDMTFTNFFKIIAHHALLRMLSCNSFNAVCTILIIIHTSFYQVFKPCHLLNIVQNCVHFNKVLIHIHFIFSWYHLGYEIYGWVSKIKTVFA